ncbi:MAG: response regulator transcription factor [Chloroflexi bacterium]|nr:response regulator transcription factor [Chloroflexota bacterium]
MKDPGRKIRVLVADDHPALREGLSRLLGDETDMEVVGVAGEGGETVRLARQSSPDVIIMDIAMPGLSGIEAAKQIKETSPDTAILMMTAYDYESYILASLRAGAAGYLLKDTSLRDVVNAVRMVFNGESVFALKATSKLLRRLDPQGSQDRGTPDLQSRELEILRLAARGISNREIALKLEISERTVQTHLVNIFRKLKVGSRTEAVLRALRLGWLTAEDLP